MRCASAVGRPTSVRDFFRIRYLSETRDHVVRIRMRGGALTLALYSQYPRYFVLKYYIMHDLASLVLPAPSLAEEGAGDARLLVACRHFGCMDGLLQQ